MKVIVLAALYAVVIAALAYAVVGAYALITLWEAKVSIGTASMDMVKIGAAVVLGAGIPYCLIRYIRR